MKDFDALAQAMKAREREAARTRERERALDAERQRAQHRERQHREQFAHAVGPVNRLPDSGRAAITREQPTPHPRQRELDEQAALKSALSDDVDLESLLLTDDGLSFRRPGIGPDVVAKLRRGHWAIQSQIDLHGLRREEAREALTVFLRDVRQRGHRCLRVVHGKGLGSPGREPVLKAKVHRWLAQTAAVVAFAQATGPQGGAGALIVLLQG